jgi:LPXTG-motif cell wall-anchored protein
MRLSLLAPFLLLLVMGSAAYEYHMPVNINPTITPAVLMPGDTAIVAIELENGAAAYGAGGDAGVGSGAQGALLSTPINRTVLRGTDEIQVISSDYGDLGMIGPSDKVTIYYKIRATENASSGTYLLDFGVQGGYDMIQINRDIPIRVDSSALSLARAEVPTKQSISLNVANPRENTVNAVTIVPSAMGISFSPDEYYIGTMDSDEVFTISFGTESSNPAKPIRDPVNLSFQSRFKNGDTWHESSAYVTSYDPPKPASNQNSSLLPIGIIALVISGAGVYLFRRKRRSKKPE